MTSTYTIPNTVQYTLEIVKFRFVKLAKTTDECHKMHAFAFHFTSGYENGLCLYYLFMTGINYYHKL